MAEDITFVHFRYGTYAEINNSANNKTLNPHAVYIATDKQLMYAKGAWIGVTSVTSEVNQDTGEITLKFNYDSEGQPTGNPITCPIKGAGMTTEQKAQLETAYKFAIDIGGTSADDIINKWQEVVDFLAGIEGGTLEGIVATKADKNTTIIAGDGLTGGGDLSENRTIKVESADDGITVNSDNIQLNTVDNLTTSSKTKPLSANQGKVLNTKVKSITDLVNDMFEKVTDNGKTYIKTKYGFASDKFVSAGGTDDTESGGSGGVNLTQMWESLQDNNDTFKDRLINVAHIPTLTTGKISDFVSATQAIANNAVANKADKATTLKGYGITDAFTWKRAINPTTTDDKALWGEIGIQTYNGVLPDGLTGQYSYGVLASFNNNKNTDSQFQLYASDSRTVSQNNRHIAWRTGFDGNKGSWRKLANINTENIFTYSQTFQKQIKSTIATGTAPFSVASTTLVTNLNADMLDGLHGSEYAKMVNLANYLPLTGGTLTGALTVNAPINNTGALKLLGASEVGSTGMAVGSGAKALGSDSRAFGRNSIANGSGAMAFGELAQANANLSFVFAYSGISARVSQTVLGRYNEEDMGSLLVIGSGTSDTARKNVFTVDANGYVRMGNRLHIGVGGKNEVYIQSEAADQLYVHTSAGIPLVIQGHTVRRDSSLAKATLGTNSEKWANVYTESLKIADANLTYDTGTLTVDKALKTTSTLTATQGEFANYVKIGHATIRWNSKGYLEINEGLASHKFISAGGVVTGDAGGGGVGLSLTDMWVSLNGNIDAYGKSKIHIDHIPLDVILSHDSYENDVANRINTFNYSNSTSFTSAVKALIVADNIPTLEMSKIDGLVDTFNNVSTVVQSNYETLSNLITNNHNDHEARIKALEQALTWQTV